MKKIFLILIIIASLIAGWWYWKKNKISPVVDPVLKIVFMDIGQGDATLIIFPNGQKMLVDCARDAVVLSALGRNLSWFDRDIDYLIATHPDADHYGGCIDVLRRYNVKHIYFNGFEKEEGGRLFSEFNRAVTEKERNGTDFELASTTTELIIASTTVNFLYPDHSIVNDPHVPGVKEISANNTSVVLKIGYGHENIILTGDMEEPLEKYLIKKYGSGLQTEILKVGHHGSKSSSSDEFLRIVAPQYCIISVGKDNAYGHPAPRALKRLERTGCTILQTDEVGDILAEINTEKISITHAQK